MKKLAYMIVPTMKISLLGFVVFIILLMTLGSCSLNKEIVRQKHTTVVLVEPMEVGSNHQYYSHTPEVWSVEDSLLRVVSLNDTISLQQGVCVIKRIATK